MGEVVTATPRQRQAADGLGRRGECDHNDNGKHNDNDNGNVNGNVNCLPRTNADKF